mmetsp:Transcript_67790/g.141343  ORF Transcript_67790/g.141343 Transcript_67790/m.141343 type:complete len:562 (-) Transcript_67790:1430-3115(-)
MTRARSRGVGGSHEVLHLNAAVVVVLVVLEDGVGGHECVLGADVEVVVDLPVHLAHLAGGVEEALEGVLQHAAGAERDAHGLDGVHDGVDHVRALLEDVGPHEVEQVCKRVLAPEPKHAERQVLDDGGGRLPVHEVAVHECVLQQRRHGVHVVLAHLADVLEEEGQRLEHAVLHVELRQAVLVEKGREHGKRAARLRHNRNRHRGAHAVLSLLHLEVVEEHGQHVLRADGFRNVAEGVDGRAADRLLVRLEHVEELEADAHPLLGAHKLGAPVGDAPDEVDAVLLHLLVPVAQNRRQPREQVLDRRRHLRHAHHVDDAFQAPENRAQHLRVLLPEVLVQHDAQMVEQLLFPAPLHHRCDAPDQVRCLLPHLGGLVVQAPLEGAADLGEVRLHALAEGVHHRRHSVQHHLGVLGLLLLEGVEDAVDHLLLQPRVDVRRPHVAHHLLNSLHDHLAVRLALVLEALDEARDDLGAAHLVRQLHRRVHQLPVVAAVQRHAPHPQMLEELRENLRLHVRRVHALRPDALLHHLHDNFLHLLVGRLELADENRHDFLGVKPRVLRLH